jgi:hypothetical protein
MSLNKMPDLTKQTTLTGIHNFIKVEEGIDRILAKLSK